MLPTRSCTSLQCPQWHCQAPRAQGHGDEGEPPETLISGTIQTPFYGNDCSSLIFLMFGKRTGPECCTKERRNNIDIQLEVVTGLGIRTPASPGLGIRTPVRNWFGLSGAFPAIHNLG